MLYFESAQSQLEKSRGCDILFQLHAYRGLWDSIQDLDPRLRAVCAVHLDRLRNGHANIRTEKIREGVMELKISWNKQEFRFLYCHSPGRIIDILVFFQKKTRKLPKR